jgi:hypothetical protein
MTPPPPDVDVINQQNSKLQNLLNTVDGANTKQDRMAFYLTNNVNFYKNINFLLFIIYFVLACIYSNFIFFHTYYQKNSKINIFIQILLTILLFTFPFVIMYIEKSIGKYIF